MTPQQRREQEQRTRTRMWVFVGQVSRRVEVSSGDRAVLRHGVGLPPEDRRMHAAHAIVARCDRRCADGFPDVATEWAFYEVAALIAAQPRVARDTEAETRQASRRPAAEPATGEQMPPEAAAGPSVRGVNLGETLAQAVIDKKLSENTTEARLHLLCRQDLAGLHRQLPRVIGHLRADLVPVDWTQLLWDLSRWTDKQRDQIAKTWLQSFHRKIAKFDGQQAASPNTTEGEDA